MRAWLLGLLAVASGGCALYGPPPEGLDPMDATPRVYDYEPSTAAKVGEAVLSVPETAIWWPYKIVTSAVRGGYDGVAGGVEKAPMPIVGVLLSPVTAGAGIVNGAVRGVTRGPAYIGSTGEFGRSLGSTWTEPIPLW